MNSKYEISKFWSIIKNFTTEKILITNIQKLLTLIETNFVNQLKVTKFLKVTFVIFVKP